MPIYEYRCTSCQAELEKLQKINDPPLVECPECGKDTLIKLISASSFRLKGSGWYETDFKTGNKKNGAAEENTGKSDKGSDKDSGSASVDADNKAVTKATESTASDSSSKKETNSNPAKEDHKGERKGEAKGQTKGETKSTAIKSPSDVKSAAGSSGSQTKSS